MRSLIWNHMHYLRPSMDKYVENTVFDAAALAERPFAKGEYDTCTFSNCDFTSIDLSGCRFIQCTFTNCNLSMVKMTKTVWNDVTFTNCKMLGLRWDDADPFGFSIAPNGCSLDHASFFRTKLRKMKWRNSQLRETDFTDCDLTEALFDNCDLSGATFDNTVLEKADLSTALNYSIDPERNKIKKARFALSGLPGLLGKYDIKIQP